MSPARVVLLTAVFHAAGVAAHPPSYADEVGEVRGLMERVRRETEHINNPHRISSAHPQVRPAKSSAAGALAAALRPGELDKELLSSADRVRKELDAMRKADAPKPKKAAMLASSKRETQEDRAARYFATHGMAQEAKLLGMGEDVQKVGAMSSASTPTLVRSAPHAAAPDGSRAQAQDYHRRWGAVDALRHRRPPGLAA
ncbi:unnamed protein product [Prorocentrum cordatum]|uniref:Uncharacterized protein n=1 Tax=Prorocentrum cordatum TaxID=2364126 RepID=A0ABN9UBM5_9DINO|nr:unnamed protein product [Polarella glacialis]|mmetsp:Transcript_118303/g.321047  ORF Transcript_118303/g.321047 Transcript_118303/m.321047 type:complete len:200 (-) Transcript_118303:35-634(-)